MLGLLKQRTSSTYLGPVSIEEELALELVLELLIWTQLVSPYKKGRADKVSSVPPPKPDWCDALFHELESLYRKPLRCEPAAKPSQKKQEALGCAGEVAAGVVLP